MSSTKGQSARTTTPKTTPYGLFIADRDNRVTLYSAARHVLFSGTAEALLEIADLMDGMSERQRSALVAVRGEAVEEQRRIQRSIAARRAKRAARKAAKSEGGAA